MDENAFRQWLQECFGPLQGQLAWEQLQRLPEELREQMMNQTVDKLPDPKEVQSLMQAFANGGLNTPDDMQRAVEEGPINVKLAKSLALGQAGGTGSDTLVNAEDGDMVRRVSSEVNLWLDTACECDPVEGQMEALTRSGWVESSLEAWTKFAAPVAQSMNDALGNVLAERLGDDFGGEVEGMFAGPIPIPIPEGMKDPRQLMRLVANTSFAMQLGRAAGNLSHEVFGGYDQGVSLLNNPAGGIVVQNVREYANELDLPVEEVMQFLALREAAHARLFATVSWLMPRFEALIGKYARGVDIDLDAMAEQLRDAEALDPESMAGVVNISNVGIADTPEQREALASLETLLALVEGWVDCVTWRAGMAHVPHIEQLREMMRRRRAVGGPAERTFESLLGMQLRPRRMREAAVLWERLAASEGVSGRDAHWNHPDLLPVLPDASAAERGADGADESAGNAGLVGGTTDAGAADAGASMSTIDWDSELSKLLDAQESDAVGGDGDGDAAGEDAAAQNASEVSDNGATTDGASGDAGDDANGEVDGEADGESHSADGK